MDLRDLTYFQVIAEEEHLGRAAERLCRSQPALTKCIHRLEESLKAKLFERMGRGIRLTPVGEILLARSRRLNVTVEETLREISYFSQGVVGLIRLGCGATTAEYLLPGACNELLSEASGVNLKITVAMNDVLLDKLRNGRLDLIVCPVFEADDTLQSEPIVEDEVVVVATRSHEILQKRASMQDLLAYRWVLPATSVASRQWLDKAFDLHGLPRPNVQIEPDSLSLMLRLIEKTGLLSFISRLNLRAGHAGETLSEVALNETTMHRRLGVTYRRDSYLAPAAHRLIHLLRTRGKDFFIDRPR